MASWARKRVGQTGEQEAEVDAEVGEPSHGREDVAGAMLRDDVEQRHVFVFVHQAERVAHARRGDVAGVEREDLVRERERVAHRAVGRAGEHAERVRLDPDLLLLQDGGEALTHVRWTDALQVEPLHAREHRRGGLGDLLRLGGGEHEDDARRRLLEDLQERVPRLAREHVRLVDDVDLVAVVAGRPVLRAFAQLARVVDAAVRCGIDLDHVERRRPGPDARAAGAGAARLVVGALVLAVERHREDARERRLARAPRTAEQVGMRDAVVGDRVLQGGRHVGLDRDVCESFRAVLAGQG